MNPALCNPAWVSVLAALLTPAIAIVVGLIAWRQWRTARERLKLDLFDRRLPIYEQTRDILARRLTLGQLDSEEITKFAINTRVSRWLFNSAIADYLEGEIVRKLHRLNDLESDLEHVTDQTQRIKVVSEQRTLKEWLDQQRYKIIDRKFGEFLQLRH
jgi:hypothetical protein